MPTDEALRIAALEAQVEALKRALSRRSEELRILQRHLSKRDLIILARLQEGLPPLPLRAYEPDFWRETIDLEAVGVEEVLADLWRSLYPAASPTSATAAGEAPETA
jgi:hypothetical protein